MTFFIPTLRLFLAASIAACSGYSLAQTYPSKPIRLIVPFAPGGGATSLAQMFGQKISTEWGQQVLVENRPGANTVIGTDAVAKAAPDGYTMLLTSNNHVISPHLLATLPYDSVRDFTPISTVGVSVLMLVVHPSVAANNLKEFIALAKSKPGQLNYSSSGSGSANHLIGELMGIVAGVKLQHIAYKGAGQAITDLIGGQVQFSFQPAIVITPHIKAGKVRPLALARESRVPGFPDLPTFTEAGLPGVDVNIWYGIMGPGGLPQPMVQKWSAEIAKVLAMPDVKDRLDASGIEPFYTNPVQFSALIKSDLPKFARIIKTANVKLEE